MYFTCKICNCWTRRMLSCEETSFSDRDDVSRFDFSENMLPDVLNTRSLLSDEAGADNLICGSLTGKMLFTYPVIRYPAKFYSVTPLLKTNIFSKNLQKRSWNLVDCFSWDRQFRSCECFWPRDELSWERRLSLEDDRLIVENVKWSFKYEDLQMELSIWQSRWKKTTRIWYRDCSSVNTTRWVQNCP